MRIMEENTSTKKEILKISQKFIEDWNQSPNMAFIAGQLRPAISMERVRQLLVELEKDGVIKRLPGKRYYAGFKIINIKKLK